jgi:hypothetical protein
MDVNIPTPNDGLAGVLLGDGIESALEEISNTGVMLYQGRVAKRSGRLAAAARAHTEIGGTHHDRHVGMITVGGQGARGDVDYALAHEEGRGIHGESRHGQGDWRDTPLPAAHDLLRVAEELRSL